MKNILLFGAGKSATVLIQFLLDQCAQEGWKLTVVDADPQLIAQKIGSHSFATGLSFDITDTTKRAAEIEKASIIISLLPPQLHFLVAKDCVRYKKNLLTASYIDDNIRSLEKAIIANDLLFLCEMGLDPGIDHMSAKKLLDEIKMAGGTIKSFISHCGGLVAPESDTNPWHYKISWNPKNVVLAGKAGAVYKENGAYINQTYPQLFSEKRTVHVPNYGDLCWYPNRDSLTYVIEYDLQNCATLLRTTLRHPDFMEGWMAIVLLQLTDENIVYDTTQKTVKQFFIEHLQQRRFFELAEAIQNNAKVLMAWKKLGLSDKAWLQIQYVGLIDDVPLPKDKYTPAGLLQSLLETKLALQQNDKDLVLMLHEIEYEKGKNKYKKTSTLIVTGKDGNNTAMAKTVGLPLGIAAHLILQEKIKLKGLHIPTAKEIYVPVLEALADLGIVFSEQETAI